MSGQTPLLPSLPAGFGTDSSYPPIPGSTRITASQPKPLAAAVVASPVSPPRPHRPTGPPLPPLPPGALEQEQQRLRRQSASHSVTPSAISSGLRPGQLVHAPTPPPPPLPPPPQPTHHFVGGFASPHQQRSGTPVAAPRPPPPPPPPSMPTPSYGLANNMQAMSIHSHTQAPSSSSSARRASANDAFAATSTSRPSQPPSFAAPTSSPPSLSAPLPDMTSLATQRDRARDDRSLVSWAKQMLKYVERNFSDGTKISEPSLVKWTDEAISIITHNASSPRPEPEALYIRADLQASGAFPTYLAKNLKEAFNDFELSARMGWAPSWFRIGRDYEVLGDLARARDAYDRGVHARDVGCIYRMGMAHLLGQLELPVHHARAVAMLRDAADKADLDTPQPAYIFGMLLAGEFAHVDIPAQLLRPANTSAAALEDEARRRILRAAYLNFAPAQYKCGWLFEYAQLGCAFDPLLSVQYYSLASQGGETEADMALSKWFLCGAESYFEKNETLAYTFADKAARKGLASAEFALGYYHEVGVGTERNVDLARKWYNKAAAKDNADARERLHALQGPQALGLSRKQHEAVMDDKLVRKRTQAKMLSDREGHSPAVEYDQYIGSSSSGGGGGSGNGQRRPSGPAAATSNVPAARPAATSNKNHLELSRKRTMKMVEETAAGRRRPNYGSSAPPAMPSVPVAPQPRPAGRLPSGTHPSSTPGRHGKGYTLNDSAPASSAPSSHSAASHAPSSAGTTSASTGTDESAKRPYNTFAEMGFAPQKPKKEECVVC